VDICISMDKIQQPCTAGESINLVNSLTEGKEQQQQLILWKLRSNPILPLKAMGRIGYGWFQGFRKRHVRQSEEKKFCCQFSRVVKKHVHEGNVQCNFYDNMVDTRIWEEIEHPIKMDINGTMVKKDDTKS
jgi:hypothetical protein